MQGGSNKAWSRPFNPHPGAHESHGSHRGNYESLNLRTPRPGFHYAFTHRGEQYRALTQSMLMQGFKPSRREPGGVALGADLVPEFGSPQDSLVGMGNLVLMEIPLEQYRENKLREAEYQKRALEGPTAAFLSKKEEIRRQMGPSAGRIEPLYATPEHGTTGYTQKRMGDD